MWSGTARLKQLPLRLISLSGTSPDGRNKRAETLHSQMREIPWIKAWLVNRC